MLQIKTISITYIHIYIIILIYLYVVCKHQKSSSSKFRPHTHQQHKMSDRPKTPDIPADALRRAAEISGIVDEVSGNSAENSRISSQNSGIPVENSDNSVEDSDIPGQTSRDLAKNLGILVVNLCIMGGRLKTLAQLMGIPAEIFYIEEKYWNNPRVSGRIVTLSGTLPKCSPIVEESLNILAHSLGIIEMSFDIVVQTFNIPPITRSIPGDCHNMPVALRVWHFLHRIQMSEMRASLLQKKAQECRQIVPVWNHTISVLQDRVKIFRELHERFEQEQTSALQHSSSTPTYKQQTNN